MKPRRASYISILVYLLAACYVVFFSWLSVRSHQAFQTSALDLGYTSQAVWNTLHGRILEFSTYQGVKIDLPLESFRRTDTLLSYHVELWLIPIALLYAVAASPAALLVLQSTALGLGALPAYWLARARLQSDVAGLVFALAYLLAPAIEGANLSDFHAVSMTAPLLLLAFYLLHRQRYGAFLACALVALGAKEDIPLLVSMMGLYVMLWHKQRRIGALAVTMGAAWFIVCTRVILPHFSGLDLSPFAQRLAIFGPTVDESVVQAARNPALVVQWLGKPEITAYLGGLLATAGFLSLFSPVHLLLCVPILAVNVFSSWSWTYSEGAHYSASIIPFIVVSAIYGVERVSRVAARSWSAPRERTTLGLAALVLIVSLYHHRQIGVSPLSLNFHPPQPTAHHAVTRDIMATIPAGAAVSTQSALYPHLSLRQKAYLFPAINDAEYILVDVTSTPYPGSLLEVAKSIQTLLVSADFRVLRAQDGLILFRREPSPSMIQRLPSSFYSFAYADERAIGHPVRVRFGDVLELVGYDYSLLTTVHVRDKPAQIVTYWRLLRPLDGPYFPVLFFARDDGAIVGQFHEATATSQWYGLGRWQVGEVMRIETPALPVGRLKDVLLGVTTNQADPARIEDRLPPGASAVALAPDQRLLRLFSFR